MIFWLDLEIILNHTTSRMRLTLSWNVIKMETNIIYIFKFTKSEVTIVFSAIRLLDSDHTYIYINIH